VGFFFHVSTVHGRLRLAHISRFEINTQAHHTLQGSSGRVIGLSKRRLPDNKQRPQETNVRAPGVIRTRNPNKRAAAEPRPTWRGNAIGLCGGLGDTNFTFVFYAVTDCTVSTRRRSLCLANASIPPVAPSFCQLIQDRKSTQ